MIKFVFQFLILFFFWRDNANSKKKWLSPSSFLIGIYLLSSFCAIWTIGVENYTQVLSSDYLFPMLFFDLFILLFLLPYRLFHEERIAAIRLPNQSVLDIFSSFLIILSFYAIFYYVSTVISIFTLSDLGAARNAIYGEQGETYVDSGVGQTIASVSASFYSICLVLYFIYKIKGKHKTRCTLLLISSLSYPIQIMAWVGRDGVVFWIFSFVFLFLLFKPYMETPEVKSIIKVFSIGAVVLMIPFVAISISRFSTSDMGTNGSIISYMGQGMVNGPYYFGLDDKVYTNGVGFPLYFELTGQKMPTGQGNQMVGEWATWNFSTFVVSLYRNLHLVGLIIFCIMMYLISIMSFGSKKRVLPFHDLFIYLLFFEIISQGVFYFRQGARGGNLYIVMCFFLALIFKFIESNSKDYVKKNNG